MHVQHLPELCFVMHHLLWMHVHESRLLAAAQLTVVRMVIFCRRMRATACKESKLGGFLQK